MAVKIRFKRMGAKKAPFYRIVVADSRYNPMQGAIRRMLAYEGFSKEDIEYIKGFDVMHTSNGAFIEELGYYNPATKETQIEADKAKDWVGKGAQPTETVRSLFKKNGIID